MKKRIVILICFKNWGKSRSFVAQGIYNYETLLQRIWSENDYVINLIFDRYFLSVYNDVSTKKWENVKSKKKGE